MSLGAALFARASDTSLAGLISHETDQGFTVVRFYPFVPEQSGLRPYVTYQLLFSESEYSHDGFSGLRNPRIQVDTWADSYAEAHAVARAVEAAFDAFTGTVEGWHIQASMVDDERDFYENDAQLFRVSRDFRMWVRRLEAA